MQANERVLDELKVFKESPVFIEFFSRGHGLESPVMVTFKFLIHCAVHVKKNVILLHGSGMENAFTINKKFKDSLVAGFATGIEELKQLILNERVEIIIFDNRIKLHGSKINKHQFITNAIKISLRKNGKWLFIVSERLEFGHLMDYIVNANFYRANDMLRRIPNFNVVFYQNVEMVDKMIGIDEAMKELFHLGNDYIHVATEMRTIVLDRATFPKRFSGEQCNE